MGRRTHTALKNFQRDEGLNATGDPNDETLSALDMREGSTAGSSR